MKLLQVLSNWIWNLISKHSDSFQKEIKELIAKEVELKMTPEKIRASKDPNIYEKDGLKIRIDGAGRSKDSLQFEVSKPLFTSQEATLFNFSFPGKLNTACSADESKITNVVSQLRDGIFALEGVTECTILPYEVSVTKSGAVSWDDLKLKITELLFKVMLNKPRGPKGGDTDGGASL